MDYIHLALITLYHVKVTNSRSKSYTLFKLKNYWERRYRCREHTKNVIILRVKDEAYLIALDCKLFVNRWHYQLVPQHIIFAEKEWIYIRHLSTLRLYELTYLFLVILCSRIDKKKRKVKFQISLPCNP